MYACVFNSIYLNKLSEDKKSFENNYYTKRKEKS